MLVIEKIKKSINTLLYPTNPKCAVCGRNLIFETGMLCSRCLRSVKFIGDITCIKCGDKLDEGAQFQLCQKCRETQFSFEGGVSLFEYDTVSRGLILDFKYNNNSYGAHCCGLMLADKVLKTAWFKEIDIITSVPASEEAIKTRGYNQSELIANAFKEKCDIIINNNIIKKKLDLKDQIGLHIKERFENMRDAFEMIDTASITGKRVLVVDDVMTTGATMNACSDVLIKAGAAEVYSATVASAFVNKNIIK